MIWGLTLYVAYSGCESERVDNKLKNSIDLVNIYRNRLRRNPLISTVVLNNYLQITHSTIQKS